MIAELGLLCLILALINAIFLAIVPAMGVVLNKPKWQRASNLYVCGQFVFVALSYLCLTYCFLNDDFTVVYVMSNSSTLLPWFYKLCAVWGGHEGSMLLWVAILSLWMVAVAFFSAGLDKAMKARVLSVLGALSIGFILFLLMTSNPFLRQFQVLTTSGKDLNPLLQDPGFLFHPPMLYMGYVGFSCAFAFAIAALWAGRIETSWIKWTRPWTLGAWCFLTAGITLGSWWAYRELGWGGWWFWDPVENASFMPWLVGTALIHSLIVSERRQSLWGWTILLSICAFSLSLIGTFLVRSGVLTSVHAFAVDPQRGLYILLFLAFVIGGSLLLFSFRAQVVQSIKPFKILSRESLLLINNLFMAVAMLTVLMGTVYPLLIDGLGLGKLSVGAPYFNAVFVPLMIPQLLLMGVGVHTRWQKDQASRMIALLKWPLFLTVLSLSVLVVFLAHRVSFSVILGIALGLWVILGTLKFIIGQIKFRGILGLTVPTWGMGAAHIGVAMTVLGIAVSTGLGVQKDVKLSPGQSTDLAGYKVSFIKEQALKGPNYHGTRAKFIVSSSRRQTVVYPEKRIYDITKMPMTDSAIDVTPFRDIYIALGEPLGKNSWSVRVYYKPLIRWIWAGGFMIFFGGCLAIIGVIGIKKRQKITDNLSEVIA